MPEQHQISLQKDPVQRLLELGTQRSLDTEDLRQALPIEQMTLEQIGGVIRRLEDAGVDIDVDPGALAGSKANAPRADLKATQVSPPRVNRTNTTRRPELPQVRVTKLAVDEAVPQTNPNRGHAVAWSIFIAALLTFGLLLGLAFVRGFSI